MTALQDKVAIVTGSSDGIGRATALKLATEGVKVVINGRSPEKGEAVADQIKEMGGDAFWFRADVMDEAEMKALVDRAVEKFGQVDIMIASAGSHSRNPQAPPGTGAGVSGSFFHQMSAQALAEATGHYVLARINPARAVVDHMISRDRGSIIMLTSEGGRFPTPGQTLMALAAGGLVMATRTIAKELSRWHIRVNTIALTLVENTLAEDVYGGRVSGGTEAMWKNFDKIRQRVPFGLAKPEDVAEVAAFLASDAARMLTGMTVSPTGGLTYS
jgi:3-oxoacyl-[acyl-carrier protein] reductase